MAGERGDVHRFEADADADKKYDEVTREVNALRPDMPQDIQQIEIRKVAPSLVNITEIVLAAKAGQLAASPAVVQALWAVHAAAFGLDLAAIAVALIGLGYAAASVRLIPAWLAGAAWPGAACLLTAAVFTVALANGGPWGAVGLAGFIIWLVFVITASVSLLRNRPIP